MHKIALIMGTRPEVIKFAPLVLELKQSKTFDPVVISTGQHRSMAKQAFDVFDLAPDIDLGLMQPNQTPNSFLSRLLISLEETLRTLSPRGIFIQGDTTSTLGAAITAFHLQIPIAHIEAGLRTYRLDSPFPEEMNRTLVSRITSLHFCPTEKAKGNLLREGVDDEVHMVGNTVVDALKIMDEKIEKKLIGIESCVEKLNIENKKSILVTGHRRENFDQPINNLCTAIKQIVEKYPEIEIVYPVHLNPNVQSPVRDQLGDLDRVHLLEPVDYPTLLYLIKHSQLIISDSGGIQEEAPSFRVRTLVTRNTTERQEAIEAGCAVLTPLDSPDELFSRACEELDGTSASPTIEANPFGNGTASQQIAEHIEKVWA